MELTETRTDGVDLQAALAATYAHHGALVAQRHRRTRFAFAAAAVLLVAGGVAIGLSLSDNSSAVRFAGSGATTPTSTPAGEVPAPAPPSQGPAVPDGFSFEQRADGVFVLQRLESPPLSSPVVTAADGVTLAGGGAVTERAVPVASHYESPDGWVTVRLTCVAGSADRIDQVLYRLDGATLTVDATVSSLHGDQPCTDLDGAVTPLPGIAVTAPVEVLAGDLR